MALKSFIINNSNKFFAKTHDYKELQAWMEKTSDKFYASFVFSWILAGVSFSIEYFIFKKDVLSNISGFWILDKSEKKFYLIQYFPFLNLKLAVNSLITIYMDITFKM